MNKIFKLAAMGAFVGSTVFAGSVMADPVNLVTNGDFSQTTYTSNTEFGTRWGGQGVTGWTGGAGLEVFYFAGTADTIAAATMGANGRNINKDNVLSGVSSSSTGGNIIALDGDANVRGSISQMINDLVIGNQYTLTFDWAASQMKTRVGDTTEMLRVSLGNETYDTQVLNTPTHTFSGWITQSFTFTAISTSELLNFLSIGTPVGEPPIALLANVSLYDKTNKVPEPATLALCALGLGMLGLTARRRRSADSKAS